MTGNQQSISLAYGDESIYISAPTPCYVMAATMLPEGADFSKLAKIKPKSSAKLHWRELTDRLRRDALAEVCETGGLTTIVKSITVLETKI